MAALKFHLMLEVKPLSVLNNKRVAGPGCWGQTPSDESLRNVDIDIIQRVYIQESGGVMFEVGPLLNRRLGAGVAFGLAKIGIPSETNRGHAANQ